MTLATVYCTQAEMERRFSAYGVQQFADHDFDDIADDDVVADSIQQASDEINMACFPRGYAADKLTASVTIKYWAVALALCYLCENRGNPPPESLERKCEEIRGKLADVAAGKDLPGVAISQSNHLAMHNLEVDRRYPNRNVRVEKDTSTPVRTTLPEFTSNYDDHGYFL